VEAHAAVYASEKLEFRFMLLLLMPNASLCVTIISAITKLRFF